MMNENRKENLHGSKKYFLCILYLLLFLILIYYSCIFKKTKLYPMFAVTLFVIAGVTFFLSNLKLPKEKIFLWLYLSVGLIYVFAIPMFRVPDEAAHFMRAYEISEGNFISKGNMPENITLGVQEGKSSLQLYHEAAQTTLSSERKNEVMSAAQYSPLSYLPQVLGILIAELFTKHILVMAYMARIINFLTAMVLYYHAVKIIPMGKNMLICIILLPIMMQEAASMNIDGILTALIMNVVAVVLYECSVPEKKMNVSRLAGLLILGIFMGQYKNIYAGVCLLYVFLPKSKFGGMKQKIIYAITIVLLISVTMLGWMTLAGSLKAFQQGESRSELTGENRHTDFSAEYVSTDNNKLAIQGTSSHNDFGKVMINTIKKYGRLYAASSLGECLGYFDINPDQKIIYLFLGILVYTGVLEKKNKPKLTLLMRLTLLFISAVTMLGIFLAIYVLWSGTALNVIVGVQGRYFTPIFVLLCLAFTNDTKKIPEIPQNVLVPMMEVLNLCVLSTVFFTCLS